MVINTSTIHQYLIDCFLVYFSAYSEIVYKISMILLLLLIFLLSLYFEFYICHLSLLLLLKYAYILHFHLLWLICIPLTSHWLEVYWRILSFPFWAALDFYGALRSRTYDRSISKVNDILTWNMEILCHIFQEIISHGPGFFSFLSPIYHHIVFVIVLLAICHVNHGILIFFFYFSS